MQGDDFCIVTNRPVAEVIIYRPRERDEDFEFRGITSPLNRTLNNRTLVVGVTLIARQIRNIILNGKEIAGEELSNKNLKGSCKKPKIIIQGTRGKIIINLIEVRVGCEGAGTLKRAKDGLEALGFRLIE